MNPQLKPDNWSLADEGYILTERLDYFNQPYKVWVKKSPGVDLSKAWQQFSSDFRSQDPRELKGGNEFRPDLELIERRELNDHN